MFQEVTQYISTLTLFTGFGQATNALHNVFHKYEKSATADILLQLVLNVLECFLYWLVQQLQVGQNTIFLHKGVSLNAAELGLIKLLGVA